MVVYLYRRFGGTYSLHIEVDCKDSGVCLSDVVKEEVVGCRGSSEGRENRGLESSRANES